MTLNKYTTQLKKWQNIYDAMIDIEANDQSRYFTDFFTDVKYRIDEYQFLAEKERQINDIELG
jgi:hypothetical protein